MSMKDYIDVFSADGIYNKNGSQVLNALHFVFNCHIKGHPHGPRVYADIANASVMQIEDLLQAATAMDPLYSSPIIADVVHYSSCLQDLPQETVVMVSELLFHDLCRNNYRKFYRKQVCETFSALVHLSYPRQILKQISSIKIDVMRTDTDKILAGLIMEADLLPGGITYPETVVDTLEMLVDTDSPQSFASLARTMKERDNPKCFDEFVALSWSRGFFSHESLGLRNIKEIRRLGGGKSLGALVKSEIELNSRYLCKEAESISIVNLIKVIGEKAVFDARLTRDIGSNRYIHSLIDYVIMSESREHFPDLINAWSDVFYDFLMNMGVEYLDVKHLQILSEMGKGDQALEDIKRAERVSNAFDGHTLSAIASGLGFQALKELRPKLDPREALEIFEGINSDPKDRKLKKEFLKAFPQAKKLILSSDLGI